ELDDPSGTPRETRAVRNARGDHSRLALVLLTVITIAALAVAGVVAWSNRSAAHGTYDLSADRAACFEFALIERRIAQTINPEALQNGTLPSVDDVYAQLREEVIDLDALGSRFPEASYHLIDALAVVADASAAIVHRPQQITRKSEVRAGLRRRFDAVQAAKSQCRAAGFDPERLRSD